MILGLTLLLYAGPILFDLLLFGWQRVFHYFAADTFYYLTVGRNFAQHGIFTFDGELWTNGFHPLWQFWLGGFYIVADVLRLSEPAILVFILMTNIITISLSIWFIGKSFETTEGFLSPWFLLLPYGLYALILSPIAPQLGSLWSFTNGMETPLVILFFSMLFFMISRSRLINSIKGSVIIIVILSGLTLARLDHIFIVPVILGFLLLGTLSRNNGAEFKRIIFIGIGVGTVIVLYLLFNRLTAGTWLPISGQAKSTFPLSDSWRKVSIIEQLIADPTKPYAGDEIWRLSQILIPLFVALSFVYHYLIKLVKFPRYSISGVDFALIVTGIFVIFLALYNYGYVGLWHQGHWYFPVSILFVTLVAVRVIDKSNRANRIVRSPLLLFLLSLFVLIIFAFVYRSEVRHANYANFFDEGRQISERYAVKLIEMDDGIIAYSTNFPSISGLGFAIDLEGSRHLEAGNLLLHVYKRGYTYIASMNYAPSVEYYMDSDKLKEVIASSFWGGRLGVQLFDLKVVYKSKQTPFILIRAFLRQNYEAPTVIDAEGMEDKTSAAVQSTTARSE